MLRRKASFEGVRVYESRWLPRGAGIAFPGFGIIVFSGATTSQDGSLLLRQEFGHILQARETGLIKFYLKIGIPSLFSAWRNGRNGHKHHQYWTETWADQLADQYFNRYSKI
jgi:hypothetical protein